MDDVEVGVREMEAALSDEVRYFMEKVNAHLQEKAAEE